MVGAGERIVCDKDEEMWSWRELKSYLVLRVVSCARPFRVQMAAGASRRKACARLLPHVYS